MPRSSSLQSVRSLAAAAHIKDSGTAKHQEKTAALAYQIARRMGLPGHRVRATYLGALLHDIGKIGIPTAVLLKPEPLTTEERIEIRKHPMAGYDILRHIDFELPVPEIVLQHHERLGGTGYPRGLANGAICIEARIIAVADVVDAFMSHRSYITDSSMIALVNLLNSERGVSLDSDVIDACLWAMDRFPVLNSASIVAPSSTDVPKPD